MSCLEGPSSATLVFWNSWNGRQSHTCSSFSFSYV
jgi:hypothetical protein